MDMQDGKSCLVLKLRASIYLCHQTQHFKTNEVIAVFLIKIMQLSLGICMDLGLNHFGDLEFY